MGAPSVAIRRLELSPGFDEIDLEASRQDFIGIRGLRPFPVGKQSADIGRVPLEQLLQDVETERAPKSDYARRDFSPDTFDYRTQEHGIEEILDDATLAMFADVVDAETVHSQRAVDGVLRRLERTAAAALYDSTTWTGADLSTALSIPWNPANYATASPISDIDDAADKVWSACGVWPNTLIINRRQFKALRKMSEILDRIIYGGTANVKVITEAALAQILGVERLLVAGGAHNPANEGQDAVISAIWPDAYAMLCVTAKGLDPTEVCVGRTFVWAGDGPDAVGTDDQLAVLIEEYREEGRRGGILRARFNYHCRIIYPQAAHLFTNVLTG